MKIKHSNKMVMNNKRREKKNGSIDGNETKFGGEMRK